jgi:hypothetical protein
MADGNDYKPKAFTPEHRELFARVRIVNRDRPSDFAEAEDWIATPPKSAEQALQRYRAEVAADIARRRERRDRSWLVAPSFEMEEDWRRWPESEAKAEVLARWRRERARTIRWAFARFHEEIQDERDRGPLQPYQLLDLKTGALTGDDWPIFDGLTPEQKVLWARRVLRIAWVMTDTAPLVSANREWLRQWDWGEHPLEFLAALSGGKPKRIPRVYARVTILDDELGTWEQLVRDALRAVEEAAGDADAPPASAGDFGPPPAGEAAGRPRPIRIGKLIAVIGVSNTTFSTYAKAAGITKPSRGKKNHTFDVEEQKRILRQFIETSPDKDVVQRCTAALQQLENQK